MPIKNAKGQPSWSLTLAIGASAISAAAFAVSLFGIASHPASGSDCALFVAPFLGIYWGRKHTESKGGGQ
jgi:hypothetical protein